MAATGCLNAAQQTLHIYAYTTVVNEAFSVDYISELAFYQGDVYSVYLRVDWVQIFFGSSRCCSSAAMNPNSFSFIFVLCFICLKYV
jgi:hypothetical protein